MAGLKQIKCTPDCGFMIRSHDENEVMEMGKMHAKKMHDMDASDEETRAMMTDVEEEEEM